MAKRKTRPRALDAGHDEPKPWEIFLDQLKNIEQRVDSRLSDMADILQSVLDRQREFTETFTKAVDGIDSAAPELQRADVNDVSKPVKHQSERLVRGKDADADVLTLPERHECFDEENKEGFEEAEKEGVLQSGGSDSSNRSRSEGRSGAGKASRSHERTSFAAGVHPSTTAGNEIRPDSFSRGSAAQAKRKAEAEARREVLDAEGTRRQEVAAMRKADTEAADLAKEEALRRATEESDCKFKAEADAKANVERDRKAKRLPNDKRAAATKVVARQAATRDHAERKAKEDVEFIALAKALESSEEEEDDGRSNRRRKRRTIETATVAESIPEVGDSSALDSHPPIMGRSASARSLGPDLENGVNATITRRTNDALVIAPDSKQKTKERARLRPLRDNFKNPGVATA